MDWVWAKIESWHAVKGENLTECGLEIPVDAPTAEVFPFDEKTCESCFRVIVRRVEDSRGATG